MKVSFHRERQPSLGTVKGVQVGTRTTVTRTECMMSTAGVGGREAELPAERATCDHPDNKTISK